MATASSWSQDDLFTSAANAFTQIRPYLPMSTHLILSALFPIYTGAHASLTRPESAAAPPKQKSKKKRGATEGSTSSTEDSDYDSEDEDAEDEGPVTKMEGLSPSDAILFPLLAGCTLAGLYMVIKWFGADILNKILGWYFSGMACFSVGKMISDAMAVVGSAVWPSYYADQGRMWKVVQKRREVIVMGRDEKSKDGSGAQARTSPLPGFLGSLSLSPALSDVLWQARGLLSTPYILHLHIKSIASIRARLPLRSIVSAVLAASIILYANLVSTPWYLTNLQGFAFSYTALQLLSPTTFGTGSLILSALFFYDIYFVFYTPLMVAVASNLDVPIKLLFPRPEEEGKKAGLAMLGLGDVVLPGIMIGLALRFDLYLHYLRLQRRKSGSSKTDGEQWDTEKVKYVSTTGKWGERFWTAGWSKTAAVDLPLTREERRSAITSTQKTANKTVANIVPSFKKTYFTASIVGYVLGMSTTLGIMHVFKHAQPALLYLVPGVLGALWSTAWWKGEVAEMWAYTEMIEEEDDDEDAKEKKDDSTKTKEAPATGGTESIDAEKGQEQQGWLSKFFGDSFFGADKSERNAKKLEKSLAETFQTSDDTKKGKPSDTNAETEEESSKGFFSFSIKPAPPRQRRRTTSKSTRLSAADKEVVEAATNDTTAPDSDSEDAVLIHKADAASFIDTSTAGRSLRSRTVKPRASRS